MPSFNGCLQITSFLCFLPRCTSPRTVLNCGILQHFSTLGTRWTHKLRVVITCPALCIYVFYVFSAHVNHIANKQYDIHRLWDSHRLLLSTAAVAAEAPLARLRKGLPKVWVKDPLEAFFQRADLGLVPGVAFSGKAFPISFSALPVTLHNVHIDSTWRTYDDLIVGMPCERRSLGKASAEVRGQCLPRSQNYWPKSLFLIAAAPSPGFHTSMGCYKWMQPDEKMAWRCCCERKCCANLSNIVCLRAVKYTWKKALQAFPNSAKWPSKLSWRLPVRARVQLTAMPFSRESLWSQD